MIECSLRRLRCPDCGVHLEAVAWARANAQHTRDFEDVVAWLAQQMAKTPITGLLRIGWDTVGRIVERVVADHLDERRLEGLVAIGVDEISYRRGQRYLTTVADHAKGAIVWCAPGRNAQTLQAFFDLLGERCGSIRAVSIDMSGGYEKAIRENVPDAEIAFDPFHVVRLAQRAVDQVRRDEWNAHERSHTRTGKWIKGTRWSLLKAPPNRRSPSSRCCTKSSRPTSRSTARSCSKKSSASSTSSTIPRSRPTPRRLAHMGIPVAPRAVRQARPHDPPPPRRDPQRDPARAQQRAPRGAQQPHPTDQPPQLRLSLRRTADRPRLPLLHPDRHPPPSMTFTPKATGAPNRPGCLESSPVHHLLKRLWVRSRLYFLPAQRLK